MREWWVAAEIVTRFSGSKIDDVGVGADRERALARVEAEQLRGVRREQLDHAVERDPPLADAERVDHLQPVLEPGAAVRDLREVVRPSVFWPSQLKAQWSVEIAESTSVRTASQSTSWFALSRGGGV